jgi:hypothetical protein
MKNLKTATRTFYDVIPWHFTYFLDQTAGLAGHHFVHSLKVADNPEIASVPKSIAKSLFTEQNLTL